MRGTRFVFRNGLIPTRIIPADAGNTSLEVARQIAIEDHPRGCGEHPYIPIYLYLLQGSSPRMRGTQSGDAKLSNSRRIIPADAGNTWTGRQSPGLCRDHPRGCGEHPERSHRQPVRSGSSPRMRGTRRSPARSTPSRRIIPADAGNTSGPSGQRSELQDHPRGCGEH